VKNRTTVIAALQVKSCLLHKHLSLGLSLAQVNAVTRIQVSLLYILGDTLGYLIRKNYLIEIDFGFK